jgi:hypothetical protein
MSKLTPSTRQAYRKNMPLTSRLFSTCIKLNACLVNDKDHVLEGHSGPHVKRLQQALKAIDGTIIASDELSIMRYGKSTAMAVLLYKTKRNIINKQYQTKPDNIVGKMTIASLDRDMLSLQEKPNVSGSRLCTKSCCFPRQYVAALVCPEKYTLSLTTV